MFEPSPARHGAYQDRMGRFKVLYPMLKDYLHAM
jgi:hypothetical protein